MLRKLLLICQESLFERLVLLGRPAPWTGARQRIGEEPAVRELCQGLRACSCKLERIAHKLEHVGTRVLGTQEPVGIEEAPFRFGTDRI